MDYKELAKAIEDYEFHASGLKHMGMAHVDVEITEIDQIEDIGDDEEIMIHAEVTLHTEDKSETYHDCTYSLDDMMHRAYEIRRQEALAEIKKGR